MEVRYDIFRSSTKDMPSEIGAEVMSKALDHTTAICILRSATGMSVERAQSIVDHQDIARTSGGWYWVSEHIVPVNEKWDEEDVE